MSKDNFSRILPKNQVEISYIKYCLQYQVSIEEILREGKELYKVTAKTLLKIRNETFDQFWEQTLKESKELGIEDPKLKRKSKIPKKLADYFIHQDEPENFADTVEGHYKAIFLKSFDLVLECMKDRFEQAGLDTVFP